MKKKLKITLTLIFITGMFMLFNTVYAAGASVSAANVNLTTGQSTNITVSVANALGWNLSIAPTGGSLGGTTFQADTSPDGIQAVSRSVFTATFTAHTPGTYVINLSGTVAGADLVNRPVSGSVTINVTAPAAPPQNQNPGGNVQAPGGQQSGGNTQGRMEVEPPTRSSNNNVTGITVSVGELTPEFNREVREYRLYVENKVTYVDISAILEHGDATYEVEGNRYLQVGENVATLTAIAEDGTRQTYTITIVRSNVMRLSSLIIRGVNGINLTPEFDPNIFEYTIDLTELLEYLDIEVIAENEYVEIEIIGADDLVPGENTIIIRLSYQDDLHITEYTITVNVPEEEEYYYYEWTLLGLNRDTWIIIGRSNRGGNSRNSSDYK